MNILTRRQFLGRALLTSGAILSNPLIAEEKAAGIKSKPDAIIYEGEYPGWPWIAAGSDGTGYCVWREGKIHMYSANGRIMLAVSKDGCKTWTPARVVVATPEIDDRNVAIVELPNRELLITYNSYTAAGESQALSVRSADAGKTWSQPEPLDQANSRTRAAAAVLKNGHLILPYYIAPGNGALAGVSTDNGRHWKTVRVPDTEGFIGDEWDVLELEKGRLLGLSRNSHKQSDGSFWKTESRDGGVTWATPARTNVISKRHNSPPQLTRFGKTPVLIYADRRMVSVSAVRSLDPNFLEWDIEHRQPCYLYNADESPIRDGSYPVAVPVGGAKYFIVDYEIRETVRRIAGYFVELPAHWKT